MLRPDREMLGGPGASVEMDCTFVGGGSPGTKGKGGVRYAAISSPARPYM
jgi:hypothetical protein